MAQYYYDLGFQNYQNEKKSVAELGHSDLLSVYESSFAKMPISRETLQILVRFSQSDLQVKSSDSCDGAVLDDQQLLLLKK